MKSHVMNGLSIIICLFARYYMEWQVIKTNSSKRSAFWIQGSMIKFEFIFFNLPGASPRNADKSARRVAQSSRLVSLSYMLCYINEHNYALAMIFWAYIGDISCFFYILASHHHPTQSFIFFLQASFALR